MKTIHALIENHGSIVIIHGAYTSRKKAEDAQKAFPWLRGYEIERIHLNVSMVLSREEESGRRVRRSSKG